MPRIVFPSMSRRSFIASSAGASLIALHPFSARAAFSANIPSSPAFV